MTGRSGCARRSWSTYAWYFDSPVTPFAHQTTPLQARARSAPAAAGRVTDVTRWGVPALMLSLLLVGAGVVTMATRGIPLGIDFSGGTLVIAEFAEPGVTEAAVRDAVAPIPGDEVVQRYGAAQQRRFLIRTALPDGADPGITLAAGVRRVTAALEAASLPPFQSSSVSS